MHVYNINYSLKVKEECCRKRLRCKCVCTYFGRCSVFPMLQSQRQCGRAGPTPESQPGA